MAEETESDKEDDLTVETSIKDAGVCEKTVRVTVPVAEVDKEFNTVLGELASKAAIPGFRAGHVPRSVVERRAGGELKRQVATQLLQRAVYAAIDKDNLRTLGEPKFEEPEKIAAARGQPFSFEFTTEVFPEFELPNYAGLKTDQEEIEVLPEETQHALDSIRERFGEETDAPADHAVANKDSAVGVLRVLVDGVEVHKEDDARMLVIDGHTFGAHAHLADSYLLGAKIGEKRAIEETLGASFPDEAHRGKKATLEFEVKGIKFLKLPPVDDELARKVNMTDVQALNDRIRSSLLDKIRETIVERTRSELLRQLEAQVKFDLPPRAVLHAASNNINQSLQQMSQMGMAPEMMGMTQEMMARQAMENGARELRRFFILSAICDKEDIIAENEEVDDIVLSMSEQAKVPVQEYFDRLAQEGQIDQIETNIKFKKAMELIVDNADINVVPRKPFNKGGDHAGHDHGGHEHALGEAEHAHGEAPPEHGHEHAHEHGGHEHAHSEEGHSHEAPKEEAAAAEHGHEHGEHGHEHGAQS